MKLEFFEMTMCCSSGICGPSVDEKLVKLQENIDFLKNTYPDIKIQRYQPQTHGVIFMANREVQKLMKEKRKAALPITALNGKVIKEGEYPTLEEIENAIRGAQNA